MKYNLLFRQGYFYGTLHAFHFLEFIKKNEFIKPNEKFKVAFALMDYLLKNNKYLDYFMEYGGEVSFKYKYERGKVIFMEIVKE